MPNQHTSNNSAKKQRSPREQKFLASLLVVSVLLVGTHAAGRYLLNRVNHSLQRGDWVTADRLQAYWIHASPAAIRSALIHAVWERNPSRDRKILKLGPHVALDSFVRQQTGEYDADFLTQVTGTGISADTSLLEDPEMLKVFLENGGNVNTLQPPGQGDPTKTALGILLAFRTRMTDAGQLEKNHKLEKILRERGARLNLFDAARFGDVGELRSQLNNGANPNAQDWLDRPLIYLAALGGQVGTARLLAENGADVNSSAVGANETNSETPLMVAERRGFVQTANYLVSCGAYTHPPVISRDAPVCAPLIPAAVYGNLEHLRFLIKHGALVNARTPSGRTALMSACQTAPGAVRFLLPVAPKDAAVREGSQSKVINLLCKFGADLNARDIRGRTALMDACWSEQLTRLLIERGAGVNIADNEGVTALMIVVRLRLHRVAGFLLANGARPNMEDSTGNTALGCALHGALPAEDCRQFAIQLRAYGAHLSVQEAAASGDRLEFAWAMAHGASGAYVSRDGNPLLLTAVHGGDEAIIARLLAEGVSVNAANPRGWTPLMVAAADGRQDLVSLLIAHGARKDLRTDSGATAVTIALRHHHSGLKPLLAAVGGQTQIQ